MSALYPRLSKRILDVADGDQEFRLELTKAILVGLTELNKVYSEGYFEKNPQKIHLIRHKQKTTLTMFELDPLVHNLQEGKEILDSAGFVNEFDTHFDQFSRLVKTAIQEVEGLLSQS